MTGWKKVERPDPYQEHHFQGGEDVGVAWNGDRIWVCLDGVSLLRAKIVGGNFFVEFNPPQGENNDHVE